jgi:hypothetical protein
MTHEEIAAAVDRLYEVSGAGDWETAATLITEDFVALEAESLPFAGEYRGIEGYKQLFTTVMGMVDVAGLDRHAMTVGDDCAVVILSMRFADPSLAPAEICETFRFRDGKCCEIKPYYYDPAAFVAASEAKKAAA